MTHRASAAYVFTNERSNIICVTFVCASQPASLTLQLPIATRPARAPFHLPTVDIASVKLLAAMHGRPCSAIASIFPSCLSI